MNEVVPTALMLCATVAAVAYWIIWSKADTISLRGALVKTASTGLLALAGASSIAALPIVLGLACGAAGDFFLARRSEKAFLAGMAAFAFGHLAYTYGFILRGDQIAPVSQTLFSSSWLQIVGAALLAGLMLSTEVWLAPRTGTLRWPVRGYVLVIGLMGFATLFLPSHPENLSAPLIRLGAALFLISDLLLALRLFVVQTAPAKRALSLALWPCYWCGQALILVGSMAYWIFPKV